MAGSSTPPLTRPPLRGRTVEAPVGGSSTARNYPPLLRPSSGGGSVSSGMAWPALGGGEKAGYRQRFASAERVLRPSSGSEALSPRPSSQSAGRERESFEPTNGIKSEELNSGAFEGGQSRPTSPNTPTAAIKLSQTGNPDLDPSKRSSSGFEMKPELVDTDPLDKSQRLKGQGIQRETISGVDPKKALPLGTQTDDNPAPNLDPKPSGRSDEQGLKEQRNGSEGDSQPPEARASKERSENAKSTEKHLEMQNEMLRLGTGREDAALGSGKERQVARQDWSSPKLQEAPGGIPPGFHLPTNSGRSSNGQFRTEFPNTDSETTQGPNEREDRKLEGSYSRSDERWGSTYERRGRGYGRSGNSHGEAGKSYEGMGGVRGRSEERWLSPESRNRWGNGSAHEENGNRYSAQGRREWNRSPASQSGGLVSPADEYQRGAYRDHSAPYGSERNGSSNGKAATPFVPRVLRRPEIGPEGNSHQLSANATWYSGQERSRNEGSEHGTHTDGFGTPKQAITGNGGTRQLPVVNAVCAFPTLSSTDSASDDVQQNGDDSARPPVSVASPQPSLALFFPKETPPKMNLRT